jgi:hypothetical protein
MMRRQRSFRGVICLAVVFAFLHCSALANTDSQVFTVTVPAVLTVSGPNDVSLTHDKSDANQAFAAQPWTASSNSGAGATINFSTNQAFTHVSDSSFKRDAKLDLAITSSDAPASWSVTTATDQTNHAGADEVATVQAASTAPGDVALNLTVTFLTSDFSTLLQGDYTTTVTATITAN